MTRVIVADASGLIDLRKGGLLAVFAGLPYRLVVPLPVRESELLDFSRQQWRQLDDGGMVTRDLTADEVGQALTLKELHPGLSVNDCFCIVIALACSGILLTGDALLRRVASANRLRVHGALWVIDELDDAGTCAKPLLIEALRIWQSDDAVFLPRREIAARLKRFGEAGPPRGRRPN